MTDRASAEGLLSRDNPRSTTQRGLPLHGTNLPKEPSWRDAAKRLHESGDDEPYAEECPECQRQERLLGADPTEEWVADAWAQATPHPHIATPDRADD